MVRKEFAPLWREELDEILKEHAALNAETAALAKANAEAIATLEKLVHQVTGTVGGIQQRQEDMDKITAAKKGNVA